MEAPKKLKIYPSASAFSWGLGVVTEYESGCLRHILIASKERGPDISKKYMELGAQHEDWYAAKLGAQLAERERVIKAEVVPGVEYSGRCDFIDTDGVVHETKASFSSSTKLKVIGKGKYKLSHLSQIVSYLIRLNTHKGVIAVGYYEQAGERYKQMAYREFDVEIVDGGEIMVDGVSSGYLVQDQLDHQIAAAQVLKDDSIGPRPMNADAKWGSPCHFCPLQSVCDRYDQNLLNKNEFVAEGVIALKSKPVTDPKINQVKPARKAKNGKPRKA